MKRNPYRTAGRGVLTAFFEAHPDRQYTVDELYLAVKADAAVGKSSVYRHLTELCEKDVIRKFRSDERQCNVYQYVGTACDCREHFHVKCIMCGAIQHLDCHASANFTEHLLREHGFSVDCGQSILYGVCAACGGKED